MNKYTNKTNIVILNYNNAEDTVECIKSIFKIDNENICIVLIDNASTNDSVSFLNDWFISKNIKIGKVSYMSDLDTFDVEDRLYSKINFIRVDSNNGYAAGNNIGIKYVTQNVFEEDYIWILNNDTIINSDTLKNLIKNYNQLENENIALLGSKILNEDLTIQSVGFTTKQYSQKEIEVLSNVEVEHISGCSVFFRVKKIKEIGYIPEEYFLYYEETDWMKHIKQKGFKIFTCLSSQLIHKHAKSTGGIYSPFVIYYMTRNQILFNRKYLNSIEYYLFILKIINRNLLKIVFYSFKNLELSKSIFTGTIDGILNKKGKKEFF